MESRKTEELQFHDKIRDPSLHLNKGKADYFSSNKKFYSIARKSTKFWKEWALQRCKGKKVLDYCCGNGGVSIFLAKHGANVVGIDISEVSVENSRLLAIREDMDRNATFHVMDAEHMTFDDNSFDIIMCMGILHHLDVRLAFPELARVLKPDGKIFCGEPLAYNPLIQLYRKRTPHLRTEWEAKHILTFRDLDLARRFFGQIDVKFFNIATLAAVPFRNTSLFNRLLAFLEAIDEVILKLPIVQAQAWMMFFILSCPNKQNQTKSETSNLL